MNPDLIYGGSKYDDFVMPSGIGDPDLYERVVVYELPDGLGCFIDLHYHLNFLIVKRLITTSRNSKFKTRVFSSVTYAVSFLRKKGFNSIEVNLNGSGLSD